MLKKLDIFPVDILSCYWIPEDGKLTLLINGLLGLIEDLMEAEDMRLDYPDNLDLFLLKSRIGLNKAREKRNIQAAK